VKIDLSSLRKPNGYWTTKDPRANYTHLLYYINVCGPLARNLPSPCHGKISDVMQNILLFNYFLLAGNIGVCVSSTKPNEPSLPLGIVEHPPKFTKDQDLVLTYRGDLFTIM
jgi:hypothetical protein